MHRRYPSNNGPTTAHRVSKKFFSTPGNEKNALNGGDRCAHKQEKRRDVHQYHVYYFQIIPRISALTGTCISGSSRSATRSRRRRCLRRGEVGFVFIILIVIGADSRYVSQRCHGSPSSDRFAHAGIAHRPGLLTRRTVAGYRRTD